MVCFRQISLVVTLFLLMTMTGCGGPRPVKGGTNGELVQAGMPIGDIQVTIYKAEGNSYAEIGFGNTNGEGHFELVLPGAKGPLHLVPGEYCCTLWSTGSRIPIPKEFGKPDTTPLKVSWTADDGTLDLELPLPKTKR